MCIQGVKMAEQVISGQAENGATFNVTVVEGGKRRLVIPSHLTKWIASQRFTMGVCV